MYYDIECPYCGREQNIDHDDGYGYEENEIYEQTCYNCDKIFVYHTEISFSYNVEKADCLNEGEHEFKPTCTSPIAYTKMQCTMCELERDPTVEEMKQILSGELKRGRYGL